MSVDLKRAARLTDLARLMFEDGAQIPEQQQSARSDLFTYSMSPRIFRAGDTLNVNYIITIS